MNPANTRAEEQQAARLRHNLQCPECFGVRVTTRTDRFQARPEGWQCEECGCQWSPPIAQKQRTA